MNNQNFYMRVLCLIIIVGAVVFYNSNAREKEYSEEIAELTERVDSLESQQEEMLTALQTWYDEQEKAAEEAQKAAEEAAKEAEEAAKEAEEAAADEEAAKAAEEAAAAEADSDTDTDGQDAGSAESEIPDDASQTDGSDADNVYQNGTFTGEGEGYGGTIEVQITIEDDTLTDVQVLNASGEDIAYLSLGKTVIDSVLAEQSTEVDTVTGATFSSTGILIAIEDALGKAENG